MTILDKKLEKIDRSAQELGIMRMELKINDEFLKYPEHNIPKYKVFDLIRKAKKDALKEII
jgi:hypothetical protein